MGLLRGLTAKHKAEVKALRATKENGAVVGMVEKIGYNNRTNRVIFAAVLGSA